MPVFGSVCPFLALFFALKVCGIGFAADSIRKPIRTRTAIIGDSMRESSFAGGFFAFCTCLFNRAIFLLFILAVTGQARLIAQTITDENWEPVPGLWEPQGSISAIAADAKGNLYVAGRFTTVGNTDASRVAKWDGKTWMPLGAGIEGFVLSLAVSGTELYAGGWFSGAGGEPANNIAKWDGGSWSALGDGVNDIVFTIAVSGRDVYAGGVFTMAGGKAIENIARWDGSSWTPLGSGTDNWVVSLAAFGSDVYAGGSFTRAGGNLANHVAKWNGNTWSSLGAGLNGDALAFAYTGTDVYVGGEFTTAGGLPANRVARWDGKAWSAVGTGMDHWVWDLAIAGPSLFAGGTFTNAGGIQVNQVAKWDGKTWTSVGSGVTGGQTTKVASLAVLGGDLFVGGEFQMAGKVASTNVAKLRLPTDGSATSQAPVAMTRSGTGPDRSFTISWQAKPNKRYQIQTASEFDRPWISLLPVPRTASSNVERFDVPGPLRRQAFFRVVPLDDAPVPPGMVLIPAGKFVMGDTFSEGDNDETPRHTVFVSAFYMDQFKVTEELWESVSAWAANNGYEFESGITGKGPKYPVHSVMWFDAVKWCNARSEMENRVPAYYTSADQTTVYRTGRLHVQAAWVKWNAGYRLPTEAEWEKAARGGFEGWRFPWGNTITHDRANYWSFPRRWYNYDLNDSTAGSHPVYTSEQVPYTNPVDAFPPNGYGLYDMAGNVYDWCWDWYGTPLTSSTYYSASPAENPRGSSTGSWRVDRGGSWDVHAFHVRVAERFSNRPEHAVGFIGFRTVLPVPKQ